MDNAHKVLNQLLVHLFNDILTIEERALINDEFHDISINDMHVIETIQYEGSRNMSSVAKDLNVTVGTLTIAINNLVKKGYVKRVRSSKDRRVVLISLTPRGQKAYKHHEDFHDRMIEDIYKKLNENEIKILIKALSELELFFSNISYHKTINQSE